MAGSLAEDARLLPGRQLRFRARRLAEGANLGMHRAERKGSGVEFLGHRPYSPGDDLRHLDRHALLRHGRYLIREFVSEADRPLIVVLDASRSMYYRSPSSGSSDWERPSKIELASLVGLAALFVAHRSGDPIGLCVVAHGERVFLPPRRGAEHLERVISRLEDVLRGPAGPLSGGVSWAPALEEVAARAPRASQLLVLSDFLDAADELLPRLLDLCERRRSVSAIAILDPAERTFPFSGHVRLRDPESTFEVETEGASARSDYLGALARHQKALEEALVSHGARYVDVSTSTPAAQVLERMLVVP